MEFLNNYRLKRKDSFFKEIEEEADRAYSIMEFDGKLFYAFNGVPMVGIQPDTTAAEILEKWKGFKNSYIEYKKKHNSNFDFAAAL